VLHAQRNFLFLDNFKFFCLFATQNRAFFARKRYTTNQQNNKAFFCFLVLVIKSMSALISVVGRRNQVSSVILFRVSLFNRVIIDKALSQITNMGGTYSVQNLFPEQLPVALWLRARLPFDCFKIASIEFPWYFPYVFLFSRVLCCNASK